MNILKKLNINFSPIIFFLVQGKSMEPTYMQGEKILSIAAWLIRVRKMDVVICRDPRTGNLILKRIIKIKKDKYFIEGDNKKISTDSRIFGWVQKNNILAKVIYPKKVYNT